MVQLIENAGEFFKKSLKIIPIDLKIEYINQLAEIGYLAIDMGEYNSDTIQLIRTINKKNTAILVLAEEKQCFLKALKDSKVDFIEIPFSILKEIDIKPTEKEEIIISFCTNLNNFSEIKTSINQCKELNISKIKLYINETIKVAHLESFLYSAKTQYPQIQLIIQLYSDRKEYRPIFNSAYTGGCYIFETSIKGWSYNEMGYNLPTEKALTYLKSLNITSTFNMLTLESAYNTAKKIFSESQ